MVTLHAVSTVVYVMKPSFSMSSHVHVIRVVPHVADDDDDRYSRRFGKVTSRMESNSVTLGPFHRDRASPISSMTGFRSVSRKIICPLEEKNPT